MHEQAMIKFRDEDVKGSIKNLLEFVERFNKQDKDRQVADDAWNVQNWLNYVDEI
jgi:hypothetical protein